MTDKPVRRPRLFTLGHSDRTFEAFAAVLEASSIKLVADIRSNPVSTRFPWFERGYLSAELPKLGLAYRWFRELGGRRPPTEGEEKQTAFEDTALRRYAASLNTRQVHEAAAALVGLAASTVVVVLCAERNYLECHRSLLSDKLHFMGVRVVHILDMDKAEEHALHSDLEVVDGAMLYRKKQLELRTIR